MTYRDMQSHRKAVERRSILSSLAPLLSLTRSVHRSACLPACLSGMRACVGVPVWGCVSVRAIAEPRMSVFIEGTREERGKRGREKMKDDKRKGWMGRRVSLSLYLPFIIPVSPSPDRQADSHRHTSLTSRALEQENEGKERKR